MDSACALSLRHTAVDPSSGALLHYNAHNHQAVTCPTLLWSLKLCPSRYQHVCAQLTSFIKLVYELSHVWHLELQMIREIKKLVHTEHVAPRLLCSAAQCCQEPLRLALGIHASVCVTSLLLLLLHIWVTQASHTDAYQAVLIQAQEWQCMQLAHTCLLPARVPAGTLKSRQLTPAPPPWMSRMDSRLISTTSCVTSAKINQDACWRIAVLDLAQCYIFVYNVRRCWCQQH